MKFIPEALQKHVDTGITTLCLCWKLLPENGGILGFTDHDKPIYFDGIIFEASTGFEASAVESSLGLSVDNMEVAGALSSEKLSAEKLHAGFFDSANIEVWQVNWQDVKQRHLLRSGSIGEVSHGDLGFTVEIRGLTERLSQSKGRIFQFGCDAVLGDKRCKVFLDQEKYQAQGTVMTMLSTSRFRASGVANYENNWFGKGTLSWTTGENKGQSLEIKKHEKYGDDVIIELWLDAEITIDISDRFTLTAGCDHQIKTCLNKFSNHKNFQGFPQMPGNDFVTGYATHNEQQNNGLSRKK